MHLSLLGKDVENEFECFHWVEVLAARDKVTLLYHFHIKDIIDEANKQINLTDDDNDRSSLGLVYNFLEQTLQEHQC